MIIRRQAWIETDKFIQITLHQPYWVGWRDYQWEGTYGKCPGLGISLEAVRYGFKVNKKIRIKVLKYGTWEISPHMALRRAKEFNSRKTAKDGKELVVIPQYACDRVEKPAIQKQMEEKKEQIRSESIHKIESLRLK